MKPCSKRKEKKRKQMTKKPTLIRVCQRGTGANWELPMTKNWNHLSNKFSPAVVCLLKKKIHLPAQHLTNLAVEFEGMEWWRRRVTGVSHPSFPCFQSLNFQWNTLSQLHLAHCASGLPSLKANSIFMYC